MTFHRTLIDNMTVEELCRYSNEVFPKDNRLTDRLETSFDEGYSKGEDVGYSKGHEEGYCVGQADGGCDK